MLRTFGLISLVATLVVGAYVWTRPAQELGPGSSQAQNDASKVVAAFNLQQTAPALEAWKAANGTYVGASLPPSSGVVVVRADAGSYCLQAGEGANVEHLVGPVGNAPVDGPC